MQPIINGKNGLPPPVVTPPDLPELARTLHGLRRRFGETAIATLGQSAPPDVAVIPTGFPRLDAALGVGGLPRGRIVDIVGPEGSGKSTLCLNVIAAAQQQGGCGVLVDTEHALDPAYARHCGVDLARLYLVQPATAETALEFVEALVRAGVAVIAVDSAAALIPRAEVETDMGDHLAGLQARLMSQALRKLVGPVRKQNSLLIFTNQLRQRSDVMGAHSETQTGGRALRHYASVRLDLRVCRTLKAGRHVIGSRIRATVTKSRVAPPHRVAEFDLFFGGR